MRQEEQKVGQRELCQKPAPSRACDGSEQYQAGCAAKPSSTVFSKAPSLSGNQGGSLAVTSEQASPHFLSDTTLEMGMSHQRPLYPAHRRTGCVWLQGQKVISNQRIMSHNGQRLTCNRQPRAKRAPAGGQPSLAPQEHLPSLFVS